MRRIDLPGSLEPADIEKAVAAAGLTVSLRTTLASYPGSIHWHLVKPGSKGTLEVTLWSAKSKAWLSLHSNREADWTEPAIETLRSME